MIWVDLMGLMLSHKQLRKLMIFYKLIKSLESVTGPVKAIVVHCGINDIRTKDPKAASISMVKSLKRILDDRPNLKIVGGKYHL